MVQKKSTYTCVLMCKDTTKIGIVQENNHFFRRDEQQAYMHIRLIRSIRVRFID